MMDNQRLEILHDIFDADLLEKIERFADLHKMSSRELIASRFETLFIVQPGDEMIKAEDDAENQG